MGSSKDQWGLQPRNVAAGGRSPGGILEARRSHWTPQHDSHSGRPQGRVAPALAVVSQQAQGPRAAAGARSEVR